MKKRRNILLIEPNYRNKYPPIGLMKLATYHKMLGDNVVFFKGEFKDFIIEHSVEQCIIKFSKIDGTVDWRVKYFSIYQYIKKRNKALIKDIGIIGSEYEVLLLNALQYFKDYYWKKGYKFDHQWDRVYITTLFTFNWTITIKTIEFAKQLVKSQKDIWIGDVMASVIPKEIEEATGIKNIHVGLLNKPGILDKNDIVIDDLHLDYSILDEIDYKYPENNAYYGYTTRGCIRNCAFCAVPIIEPEFNKHVPLSDKISGVIEKYGEKKNLLLLDNNVLASPCFPEIVKEIQQNGFDKKIKYYEPNQLNIVVKNLEGNFNDRAFVKKSVSLFHELLEKLKGKQKQEIYNLLANKHLLKAQTATKAEILEVFPIVNPIYEKIRNKVAKQRYVDFNQGVDARLLTKEKANLLSQIPINPLRIAFDSMKYKKKYVDAIILAKNAGIKHFSNYLLYNYEDEPNDLYQRLRINIELCENHKIDIYSFPMKYHPIFGDYHLNRNYLGPNWNRKFIRAIQVILNATKGKIGKGRSFFYKAFGKDENEFKKLLYMPDTFILFRFFFEKEGYTEEWWKSFNLLTPDELDEAKKIIKLNNFKDLTSKTSNENILNVLQYYTFSRENIVDSNSELFKLKVIFDKLEKTEKYGIFELSNI